MSDGWIGVDLDGTLAHYDGWQGIDHIGEPIKPMLDRVKRWLKEGRDVRIFTARVDGGDVSGEDAMREVETVKKHIRAWCRRHLGRELPITNVKDYGMIELWDDRCVQVIQNEGTPVGKSTSLFPRRNYLAILNQ
jgi:hypothetical protein